MINYHFVFCPRYRRKLFLIDGFEARFKELTTQICEQNDIVILAMECHIDHTETLKYNIEALKAAFPASLKMHENTKKRLQEAESYLPASVGF